MEDNNNQGEKTPTKKEKAEQAGKDVAELAAKGAANYFGGPVGGAIANKVAQTKAGQKILNTAGKNLAKNPLTRNTLAKAQPAIQNAKPALDTAVNSMGGNMAGASGGAASGLNNNAANASNAANNLPGKNPASSAGNSQETSNLNNPLSSKQNNSGFGNDKSGLFSNNNNEKNSSGNIAKDFKKAKKIIQLISTLSPFLLMIFVPIFVIIMVMVPIMTARDYISDLVKKFTTGVEKFINFTQGDGWMTNEQSFFSYLDKEYKAYLKTVDDNSELDVPLVAATIHYSKMIDFEAYEDSEGITDDTYDNNDFSQLGSALTKDQTVSFYYVAKDKLGSVNTLWPGQKRLLGHLVDTKISVEWVDADAAGPYWKRFFALFNQTIASTVDDAYWNTPLKYFNVFTAIPAFIDLYNKALMYYGEHENIFAGAEYDVINLAYEVGEFLYSCKQLFDISNELEYETNEETEETEAVPKEEQDGLFRLPVPVITRKMHHGFEEYKQMREDMRMMRFLLSKEGIESSSLSRKEVLKSAKNSSNTELNTLGSNYESNENKYKYSYTHYLQNVYIPFTYFYGKEYNLVQVDEIVEEIFDQRDFYKYLVGDSSNYNCGGSCVYPVGGQEINNLKVRLLQCGDETRGEPIVGEDLVDFEKYILGVTYAEIGPYAPLEAGKVQSIAARSYALTRAKEMGNAFGLKLEKENGNWVLSIRNCTEDQVYCDPDRGCSKATDSHSATVYSGSKTKSIYIKPALPEDATIRSAVSAAVGKVLLDENKNIVPTGYIDVNQRKWMEQANSGMDYTEILLAEYERGSTISSPTCSKVCNAATGDFTQWKQGGSPWSDIVMSSGGKTIGQIGCLATSVSIQIARSRVPLTIPELNPGTFVETLKKNDGFDSNGNYYWDKASVVAPTFIYRGATGLSGLTQATKAQKIQDLINEGCYVIMEVKSGCNKGEHYVAVDYVNGNEVFVMDPASTNPNAWEVYGASCTSGAYCYKVD